MFLSGLAFLWVIRGSKQVNIFFPPALCEKLFGFKLTFAHIFPDDDFDFYKNYRPLCAWPRQPLRPHHCYDGGGVPTLFFF